MARKLLKRSPRKQSFFKILVGDFSKHLRIPPKFIENFNGRSLRNCVLKGPRRKCWDVELKERKDGLFFHEGWQGFVKDHCLEVGDFLVFDYDGESKFSVTIYDRSACEKDVEVAEQSSGSPVSLVNKRNQARVKDESVELETENHKDDCENRKIGSGRRNCNYFISTKTPFHYVVVTSTGSTLFESENPCFVATSNKRYLKRSVYIPIEFARAQGLVRKDNVILQDPSGRSWPVKLIFQDRSYTRLDMSTGWSKCHRANQISRGDAIVFELVNQTVMKIHIFKKGTVGGNGCCGVFRARNCKDQS